ncbi:MAG: hypothetical protein ACI8TF_003044 [Paracoccaceae bacterium]
MYSGQEAENMTRFAPIMIALMALGLSACATPEAVSRGAPLDAPASFASPYSPAALNVQANNWSVQDVTVTVPRSLEVSEANGFKPRADILWRDDPYGDRYVQVETLMQDAFDYAFRPLNGPIPVNVEITVNRFHAVTERARYTIGGDHEIVFTMIVRDAQSGDALSTPETYDVTFRALGGSAAIAAEQRGLGQKERIQSHLAGWTERQFGLNSTAVAQAY